MGFISKGRTSRKSRSFADKGLTQVQQTFPAYSTSGTVKFEWADIEGFLNDRFGTRTDYGPLKVGDKWQFMTPVPLSAEDLRGLTKLRNEKTGSYDYTYDLPAYGNSTQY